jgi:hypothetical protein
LEFGLSLQRFQAVLPRLSSAGGFFFHGMSGNFSGGLAGSGLGFAISNSGSLAGFAPGGDLSSLQEATRA